MNKYFAFSAIEYTCDVNDSQIDVIIINKRKVGTHIGIRMSAHGRLPPRDDD